MTRGYGSRPYGLTPLHAMVNQHQGLEAQNARVDGGGS